MHFSSVTENLQNLGSEKWGIHNEARKLIFRGHDIIELTIGEPDIDIDVNLIDECERSMRAGRTRYSNGRGEKTYLSN